ncbi:MAG: heterodisulfide reductase-related iron-sulfur binding cluster, partial [Bacilli bacterium]
MANPMPSLIELQKRMKYEEILNCTQCGFCLPACPTYQEIGKEVASPRGRISLMKAVSDGKLEVTKNFDDHMYLCLGCRACETACPSGVKYGELIEAAREVVEDNRERSLWVKIAKDVTMKKLFPHPSRMKRVGNLIWFYQRSGLQTIARKFKLTKLAPGGLGEIERSLPSVPSPKKRKTRQATVPAIGTKKMRVGLFTGCIMDAVFWETNEKTARVLSKAGCEVVYVIEQTCCGALHAHAGNKSDAYDLAKRNIIAYEKGEIDVFINNAGGCGSALKEYGHWFHDDPEWEERAIRFSKATKDVNEFLCEIELPPMKPVNKRVTYQDSCHLAHGQKVRLQPRKLLHSIPGLEFVEMVGADNCCGSAGIYNVTNNEMS